ncbi:oxygenase MpaB family protein [Paraconexibacter sp. AEG42_29]
MSTPTIETRLRVPPALDVPEGLPAGIDLGRINNREEALRRFGTDFVHHLTDHALRGEDLAYQAYLDYKNPEIASNWGMFERALEHGIDALDDPADSLVALFDALDDVPDWVDYDQLERGAIAYWRGGAFAPMAISYAVIGAGFSMYSSTRPVLFSGRLNDPKEAGPRMVESFRWVVAAHTPGAMVRDGEGFCLTARVRMIHAAVRHVLSHSEHWDWPAWGVPINSLDQMNTQAGQFGACFVDSLRMAGIKISDREEEDIFALTRYIGWVIGVEPTILHTGVDDARMKGKLHRLIEQPADDDCRDVVHSIIDFSTEKPPGDVEILPAPVAAFMTTERRRKLAYGLIASWLPEFVDGLGVEMTNWRFVLPTVRPFMAAKERVTRPRATLESDRKITMKTISQFNAAIALPQDAEKGTELAGVDKLQQDVSANKGNVKKAPHLVRAGV